jgi:hypothetical protein
MPARRIKKKARPKQRRAATRRDEIPRRRIKRGAPDLTDVRPEVAPCRLTERWTPLDAHAEQRAFFVSVARFNVVPAGRRSGKTELAKRRMAIRSLSEFERKLFCTAPTYAQAKRIFWEDMKDLIPDEYKVRTHETELTITTVTGSTISVVGLDKPERIDGITPVDGIIVDEIANCKAKTWQEHVLPALSTKGRLGTADLIGVPEGRNFYWHLWRDAEHLPGWARFHWKSAEILSEEDIAAARAGMDEATFRQEMEGSFEGFDGRAYYAFTADANCVHGLAKRYDPSRELVLCFDFNVDPGVAAVVQEIDGASCAIGEVWIPRSSNTQKVCRAVARGWGEHKGEVVCYGDATGGARGSAKVRGSDWDIIREELDAVFPDVEYNVPKANPRERVRVNAMNARVRSAAGDVRLLVDPNECPHLVDDMEGVALKADGSGEIDKDPNKYKMLTHMSDGVGYYVAARWPIRGMGAAVEVLG